MGIKCSDLIKYMEELAPVHLAEEWDNVGLLIGNKKSVVNRILVCLDVTMKVVDEAVEKKADIIVSHHPFLFKGLKRITEDDIKGKVIYKLIKNNIGVYSAHTNLDVTEGGINEYLAQLLGITNIQNLKKYKTEKLYKIVVFVPQDNVEVVRSAMTVEGAGWIGNYSDCSFMVKGTGTFKPLEGTKPFIGQQGKLEKVEEYRLETIVPQNKLKSVLDAMIAAHPYEEVAYDIYPLELNGKSYGLGKVGLLTEPQSFEKFIENVKLSLELQNVRVVGDIKKDIMKVAVFCGSFDEGIVALLRDIDVLVTGDLKYHISQDITEMGLCVIDAGHFGTERIMVPKLAGLLKNQFSQVEVITSTMEKDPFKFC